MSGKIPGEILPLISRISIEQEAVSEAIANRDLDAIFEIFANDPLVTCSYDDAKKRFKEMVMNTKAYLTDYPLDTL